jgi:hypothetical protein
MNIYILMILLPMGFGAYGLVKGRLPVSSKRKVIDGDAKRFGLAFVLIPLVVIGACTAVRYLLPLMNVEEEVALTWAVFTGLIGLPLVLAFTLERAIRVSVSNAHQGPRLIPPKPGATPDTPDFSYLDERGNQQ